MKYRTDCTNRKEDNECEKVGIEEQVDFTVSVTAVTCTKDTKKQQRFVFTDIYILEIHILDML